MACRSCQSANQLNFGSEINIHFPGLVNLTKPTVSVFPQLLICSDCGFVEFSITKAELRQLTEGVKKGGAAQGQSGA